MQLSLSMSNVLHQAIGDTINIVYQPARNVFDNILFLAAKNHNFYIINQQSLQYHTNNSIVLPHTHIDFYSYNLWITNDPLSCIDNHTNRIFHLNSLIFVHQDKPQQIKKEDREIINKTLWSYNKVFLNQNHLSGWQLHNKEKLLHYGVPLEHIYYRTHYPDRPKDVLIIGNDNNVIYPTLKQAITNLGYSCDIDSLDKSSLDTINDLLNQYKVLIDLSNTGWINCLCSIAAGCYAIHNTDNEINSSSIDKATSLENIIEKTQTILTSHDRTDHVTRIQNDRLVLKAEYNFDIFSAQINNMIETLSKREVYIA